MKVPTLHGLRSELILPRWRERVQNLRPHLRFHPRPVQRRREAAVVEAPSREIVQAYCTFSKWASIIAMIVGYHVFLGWAFDISVLTAPTSTFSAMKVNAAVCSFFAGAALYVAQMQRPLLASRRRAVIATCAVIVGVLSVFTFFEYLFNVDLRIDNWLFPARAADASTLHPGRMTISSALAFLLIAVALSGLNSLRYLRFTEGAGLAAAAMSLLAIAGYLYQAKAFDGQMPFYTGIVVFFLAAGILSAHPDRGFMAKIASDSFGGIMARRILPATLIFPVVLGWLQHRGLRAGLYSSSSGLAFFSVANIVVFVTVVWWGVSSLHRMDTKRRQAEEELKNTAAKLSRSNADLEQFAYVASHDLKEPLRAISGSVQILQERYRGQMNEAADEVIKHTVDGATRMQKLIDDLLTYSRLTTREAPFAPTDCESILREVVANLDASIKESRAIVTHDPLPTVNADRTQLLQVFQNLVSNGIKYRSERTPKIHVNAEDRGAEWLFSVRDNGIGIAPQYADRIFRLFQRLHTRKEYSGTGIGLAVCKKIVERHGGRIWVESEPEEGSTFFFTLPK